MFHLNCDVLLKESGKSGNLPSSIIFTSKKEEERGRGERKRREEVDFTCEIVGLALQVVQTVRVQELSIPLLIQRIQMPELFIG